MKPDRFEGFSPGSFRFLSGLAENNNKAWFDEHRREYDSEVLAPVKAFVAELGPILNQLDAGIETEPRVGLTISRINNDIRFQKNRPPYRAFIHAGFPRRGEKWSQAALLYLGLYPRGLSIGFYPGGHIESRPRQIQERIKNNLRLFQRYLDERRIPDSYWELAGGEQGAVTKWPLPRTAKRWVNLDGFNVGEYFPSTERRVSRRSFLDVAREIFVDLYPLWLFAASDQFKAELDLYWSNAETLAVPLTKVALK